MKFTDKEKEDMAQKGQRCPFGDVSQMDKNVHLGNVPKWTLILLIVGMLIRVVGITDMPNALNCDEASAGYEAFSILNYGIDRNRKQNASVSCCMGEWAKCVAYIFDDSIYKNTWIKYIICKASNGYIRMHIINYNVFIVK